ncbi:hypothetical protein GCM10027589_01470 [Actinocorallia lasiicapitis]
MSSAQETLPAGILPLELEDPVTVGGMVLLGRLGTGGMGTVFLAQNGEGRRVAVKTIHPRLAADQAFRARFASEVANAGRVASFCTAQVLGHGEDTGLHRSGLPYMVSEFIGGVSLARRVHDSGPLPVSDLHGVAVGVATALAAIHEAGLVHRDLKPSNVVLTLSGPRVIDFGIARALDSATSWTTTGTVLGTPGWMAPEVLVGGKATSAADIFGWGLLMAYAGTGRPAFGEGQALDVARRVVQDQPDLAGLPSGALGQLIRSALCKNPADRPSAPELMMRLVGREFQTRAAAADPIPDGFRYRKQLMVGALMLAVAALAVGVTVALPGGGDTAPNVTIQPQVTPDAQEQLRAVTTPPLKRHKKQ